MNNPRYLVLSNLEDCFTLTTLSANWEATAEITDLAFFEACLYPSSLRKWTSLPLSTFVIFHFMTVELQFMQRFCLSVIFFPDQSSVWWGQAELQKTLLADLLILKRHPPSNRATSFEKCHEFTVASLLTPAARNFIFPKHRVTRQTTF